MYSFQTVVAHHFLRMIFVCCHFQFHRLPINIHTNTTKIPKHRNEWLRLLDIAMHPQHEGLAHCQCFHLYYRDYCVPFFFSPIWWGLDLPLPLTFTLVEGVHHIEVGLVVAAPMFMLMCSCLVLLVCEANLRYGASQTPC